MKISNESLSLIYLDFLDVPYKKMEGIVSGLSLVTKIFELSKADLKYYLDKEHIEKISKTNIEEVRAEIESFLKKYSVEAITILDEEYPYLLKQIDDPPFVLYTIGDKKLLNKKCFAIVGTRKPTFYGRDVANDFSAKIAKSGLVTVSGLSYGIDACCARETLKAGGKTIAVLAGGLDNIYPSENVGLAREIAQKGLLVSEYRPTIRPKQYTFIRRNRIISGLSEGTLVVEAGVHSGATSTAMFAIEQGRELFCVPGNITSEQSKGTNELISRYPECLTLSPKDILDRFGIASRKEKKTEIQLDLISSQILNLLDDGEMHIDEICENLKLNMQEISTKLSMLEIMGKVRKLSGNYYEKINSVNY